MHYTMEWKLTLNRRAAAKKQTENDLVIAPGCFWRERLSSQTSDIVKATGKPCEPEATTIVVSVNDRDITKRSIHEDPPAMSEILRNHHPRTIPAPSPLGFDALRDIGIWEPKPT
ncbi:hypothetical protein B0T17DRAFT_542380 [Bombardia bombarda]|uniref:Uncharacterized protein n=1 Tax=Bombardia bombarda TaxID=252184 RepID=A0AA39WD42_9PEZI|nr:hypothetical protein B0T17DRAFT_542380 [Bombardia bombarda]